MGPKWDWNSDKRYPTGPGFFTQVENETRRKVIIVGKEKEPKLGSEVGLEEGYKNVIFC